MTESLMERLQPPLNNLDEPFMATKKEIIDALKHSLEQFHAEAKEEQVGTVVSVADGTARMTGLTQARASEMLEFPGGVYGGALNLEENGVGAIILGESAGIKEGDTVKTTGRILSVPI